MSWEHGALAWSASHNSEFELDKTACIEFTCRREPTPGGGRRTRPVTCYNLCWGEHRVATVAEHPFLGVIFDQELRWEPQVNRALAKGMSWAGQLHRIAKASYGVTPSLARKLYQAVAVPRFTYAADVWFQPVTLKEGTCGTGSIGAAHRLSHIQRVAATTILGGLRSTPTTSLDAHANLLPTHLLLNQVCAKAAIRLVSVPETHPLFMAVQKSAQGRKAHRTTLHCILPLVGCHPAHVAKRPLRLLEAATPTRSFPTKKLALRRVAGDCSHIQLFADGSYSGAGVGAAAVLLEGGSLSRVAGFRLGDQALYSILDAELASIWLALHVARMAPLHDGVVIYSDSQVAIHLVDPSSGTPHHALAKMIRKELCKLRGRHGGTEVRLAWCPGHAKVRGSELADQEAKLAAAGKDFGDGLPASFARLLPLQVDPGHLKQELGKQLEAQKLWVWEESAAGAKHLPRFRDMHARDFLKRSAGLPRRQVVLLYRLITGHVPLQKHLWIIGKADSPICPSCGTAPETVAHFILHCPAHAAARHHHTSFLGSDARVLERLFSEPCAYPALFRFISATGRFSSCS
jgi:ribonuclease HI